MKTTWIVSVLLVSSLFGSAALAADGCLQQATNSDLLQEISRRLGGSGPTGGTVSVTFSCGGNAEVIATAVSLVTGTSSKMSTYTGNWDRCRSTAELLTRKFGSPLSGGRLYAVCGGNAQIFKIAVLTDGTLKQVADDYTGNWDTCYKTADAINNALQP